MPCRYVIDGDRRLVITTGWERVTFAEALAMQNQMLSDPGFNPAFSQLIDGTAITVFDVTADEAKRLVGRAVFSPKSRRAFVASSPAVFGMARLMESYHNIAQVPEQVSVFHDHESALKWLGLEGLPDPPHSADAKKAGQ
jgi:hypothetical protein